MLKITGPLSLRSESVFVNNAPNRRIVCVDAFGAPTLADFGEDTPISKAYADLFAASLDMQEALENTIPFLEQLGDFIGNGGKSPSGLGTRCDAILAARKALAKACGQ